MPFGTYVQAYEDHQIKNDNKARTIDAIYLRAKPKTGHELMNLETGEVITRGRIWELPITSLVIRAVEEMAYNQGIKSLKITGKNKVPLLPANWVAGVEHDQDLEDGEDEDYMPMDDEINDTDDDEFDEEEVGVVYNVRLRLEQASLYEMLINHNLFEGVEASPQAISIVQDELKHFLVRRLEVLMGIRQPEPEVVQQTTQVKSPFNGLEVEALKALAYKLTEGKTKQYQEEDEYEEEVVVKKPNPIRKKLQPAKLRPKVKKTTAKKTTKVQAEPPQKKKTTTRKKKAAPKKRRPKKNNVEPRKKIAPSGNGRVLTEAEAMEIAKAEIEMEKALGRDPKKDKNSWSKMSAKQKRERIKEVNERNSKGAKVNQNLRFPTAQELEAQYTVQQQKMSTDKGVAAFNNIVASHFINGNKAKE